MAALLFSLGLLFYENPVPISSSSFVPVARRRILSVLTMLLVAVCHSLATVTFQTLTRNKVITPSIMGFDSIYTLIHTLFIFFMGSRAFNQFTGPGSFLLQIVMMVIFCVLLYGFLFSKLKGDLQIVLLLGIVLGSALNSIAVFIRKILSPSEFDILQARLLGSVNNADADFFPIAIPIILAVLFILFKNSKTLDVLSLGKETATNLGVNYRNNMIFFLVLVSLLMAVATALIGSLAFYGFLVAAITYQLTPTQDHKYLFLMSMLVGFVTLTGTYFVVYHIYDAQGVVSVVIDFVGGLVFLAMLLRKRKI